MPLAFKPIELLSGSHADTGQTGRGCFMNVIAYLNGEAQITDRSECVCVVVRPIAIWINDFLGDSERHILLPYIERAMPSATRDREELFRRAIRSVKMAEEMRDLAATASGAGAYAAEAVKAALEAAHAITAVDAAKAPTYAARASTCAVRACTYAAKACDYLGACDYIACDYPGGSDCAAEARTGAADAAYAIARARIIGSCMRFLDDCLPQGNTAGRSTLEPTRSIALAWR
jgi:hypothetical protein